MHCAWHMSLYGSMNQEELDHVGNLGIMRSLRSYTLQTLTSCQPSFPSSNLAQIFPCVQNAFFLLISFGLLFSLLFYFQVQVRQEYILFQNIQTIYQYKTMSKLPSLPPHSYFAVQRPPLSCIMSVLQGSYYLLI